MLRLLGFLVLVAVAVGGVGFVRDWFQIETSEGGNGTSVTLTVDEDKAKDDIAVGKEKVSDLFDKGKEAGGGLLDKVSSALESQDLKGVVKKINVDKQRLKVTPEGGGNVVAFTVLADQSVRRNGSAATLGDLMAGDTVEVTYGEKDGKNIAIKVEASGS